MLACVLSMLISLHTALDLASTGRIKVYMTRDAMDYEGVSEGIPQVGGKLDDILDEEEVLPSYVFLCEKSERVLTVDPEVESMFCVV